MDGCPQQERMKATADRDASAAPADQPGVELAVQRLAAELQRLLGEGTEYCLVISQDCADVLNVQAITNAQPTRAIDLLHVVLWAGEFETTNKVTREN